MVSALVSPPELGAKAAGRGDRGNPYRYTDPIGVGRFRCPVASEHRSTGRKIGGPIELRRRRELSVDLASRGQSSTEMYRLDRPPGARGLGFTHGVKI